MMDMVQTLLAFVATLGVLITVHELGHFLVARRAGVHVVRFSVGFGPPLWRRQDRHGTEFVLAAFPLGGYVRMYDEREGPAPAQMSGMPANQATVWWRMAIALGGPLANFLLAILAYWLLFMVGVTGFVPVVGAVAEDSLAARAGLAPGSELVAVDGRATPTWQGVSMQLAARLGDSGELVLSSRPAGQEQQPAREHRLALNAWQAGVDEPDLLGSLGITPTVPAVVGTVVEDSAAAAAGLQAGDHILSANGTAIGNWRDFVSSIQAAAEQPLALEVQRAGRTTDVRLVPGVRVRDDGERVGFAGVAPLYRELSFGPLAALPKAVAKTWDTTVLTLDMIRKMLVGLVSTSNLSGPITIAKVAGDSARSGGEQLLGFLALLSVSLGVLNLLPVPVLDGGHVLYCLVEIITRRPVPERVQLIGLQVGVVLVAGLMLVAIYNDIARLLG